MDALATIQRLAGGHLMEELTEALTKTAEEVVETQKAGTVTLQIKIAPAAPASGDPFVVMAEKLSRTSPKKDPRGAFFYVVDGELHREDPRQPQFEFRTVDPTSGEVREATSCSLLVREA